PPRSRRGPTPSAPRWSRRSARSNGVERSTSRTRPPTERSGARRWTRWSKRGARDADRAAGWGTMKARVENGDTVEDFAERYNLSVARLEALNHADVPARDELVRARDGSPIQGV